MSLISRREPPTGWTAADLVDRFGPILLGRIRHDPAPGLATERDVSEIRDRESRLYELIDGTLVEKAVGYRESWLAALIVKLLGIYNDRADLGLVAGADGMARLAPGLIRIPDVSFVSWERLPGRRVPDGPWLTVPPDLAVEVLSPTNTSREMEMKRVDYFEAGVRLVWFVDPAERTVVVSRDVDQSSTLRAPEILDGGDVLPGFAVPVARLFEGLGDPTQGQGAD